MGVALSIIILFTVTTTIVRVAGVVLEHSGIPRPVARMQAMSALSGTGFTTTESELLLQTPERRKVLVLLMVAGSLGLGSVVATLVLGIFGISETPHGLLLQGVSLLAAALFVRFILFTKRADRFICNLAVHWLERQGSGMTAYLVLQRLGDDATVAEHRLARVPPADPEEWGSASLLIPLAVRAADGHVRHGWPERAEIGQAAILSGPAEAHAAFAAAYGTPIVNFTH
ncbi:MAG: hypothetical protein KDE03_17955 [Rhodobacteraceae bacterium]|nr:hypothetical protein [Paracoccaceae bacterium]